MDTLHSSGFVMSALLPPTAAPQTATPALTFILSAHSLAFPTQRSSLVPVVILPFLSQHLVS